MLVRGGVTAAAVTAAGPCWHLCFGAVGRNLLHSCDSSSLACRWHCLPSWAWLLSQAYSGAQTPAASLISLPACPSLSPSRCCRCCYWCSCRIKNQKQAFPSPPQLPPDAHAVKGWISGVIYPDDSHLQQYKDSNLVMHTSLGDIEVQLLPELAPASVRELRRMARLHAQGFSKCGNCRIYRPEPGFLVQGLLEAPGSYVAVPRFPSPQQPTTMPKGMVCWAGGTGGPHWFVNVSAVFERRRGGCCR